MTQELTMSVSVDSGRLRTRSVRIQVPKENKGEEVACLVMNEDAIKIF